MCEIRVVAFSRRLNLRNFFSCNTYFRKSGMKYNCNKLIPLMKKIPSSISFSPPCQVRIQSWKLNERKLAKLVSYFKVITQYLLAFIMVFITFCDLAALVRTLNMIFIHYKLVCKKVFFLKLGHIFI